MAMNIGLPNPGGMNSFVKPKPVPPAPVRATGDATNDEILKRLNAIEHHLIKVMHHTEAVVTEAVNHLIKAQKNQHR